MNLPNLQPRTKCARRLRVARVFTAIGLISNLFIATSVQAGPVTINQVVQTLTSTQGPANLQLVTQDPAAGTKPAAGQKTDGSTVPPVSGDAPQLDKLLSGMSVAQEPQNLGVEIVEEGEVEGTICDCGDILLPSGGIPKWPFLFLAAVPLAFIHTCEDCNDRDTIPTPKSTPTPTSDSTPTPTPEPASLLLFGTGLMAIGAGLRRRYGKARE